MKKIFLAFVLGSALVSCKKETNTPTTNGNSNTIDTIKTSTNDVSITSFDCSGVKINGTLKKGELTNGVIAQLSYTGGNGKLYSAKSYVSTGITGLTATLSAGTLVSGNGTLQFIISGTPALTGKASISIDFGGKTCAITLNVEETSQSSGINFTSNETALGTFQTNITDIDGNTYKTVKIGNKVWMAENLKVSKYNDGTIIPSVTDNSQWKNLTTGAWSYYNNDANNNANFGKIYNWFAVSPTTNGNKNVCPTGWHVPTSTEWSSLDDYLGGTSVAGGKMKEVGTTSWNSPNKGASNTSLFTALPGGYRDVDGSFRQINLYGYWWSTTENNLNTIVALYVFLRNSEERTYSIGNYKVVGYSVRCIKD